MSKIIIASFIVEEGQLIEGTEMEDFQEALNGELGVMKEHGVYYSDWVVTDQKTADRVMKWLTESFGKRRRCSWMLLEMRGIMSL